MLLWLELDPLHLGLTRAHYRIYIYICWTFGIFCRKMFLAVYSSQIYGLWQRFWRYVAAVAFHQALMKKKQPVAYATCLLMSVEQSCNDTICHSSMNFGNYVQNFQQWPFKSPSDNEWKMKVYLKWKCSFSTSKAFLHFMKSCWARELRNVSNEGQNMSKNWEKQQPSHLIASIWSFGFLKEIGFFLRKLKLESPVEFAMKMLLAPFFATKRKLPRSNPCMFDRPRARPIDRDRIWRHRVPKMSLRCPRMKRMPVLGQKLQLSRNLDIWNHEESEIRLQLIRRIVEYSDWGLHVSCLMLFQKSKLTIHRYLHDVWSQDASTSHPLSHSKLSSQGGRRSALPSSSEFWELGWDGSRTERLYEFGWHFFVTEYDGFFEILVIAWSCGWLGSTIHLLEANMRHQ